MSLSKKILATGLLTIVTVTGAMAANDKKKANVLDLRESITDNAIVYPESFETNTLNLMESWYIKNYTATDENYEKMKDPNVSDDVIRQRLADMHTEIDMPFNQIVRQYIDRYTKKSRRQVAALLGLSTYYIPIFEQELEAQGLPLELKYLPIIESGLDPNAVSVAGATGLWQLMLVTGKGLGMEVSTLIDERRDPYVSSKKAAALLKDLYNTYGDWSLAIAAYNCGPGNVNKALRRAGGDPSTHDFWSIYEYLPKETRGYVPMFIAANYVMEYYQEHNISPVLTTRPLITDTININYRINFDQISDILQIPVSEIRILNPQFRKDIIPGTVSKPYHLILPSQQIQAFIVSENEIKDAKSKTPGRREVANPGDLAFNPNEMEDTPVIPQNNEEEIIEEVVVEETPDNNDEPDNEPVQQNPPATTKNNAKSNSTQQPASTSRRNSNGNRAITHKVGSSETLSSIAQYYGVSQEDIKQWNNLNRDAVRTGQQLRIIVPEDAQIGNSTARNNSSKPNNNNRQQARNNNSNSSTSTSTTATAQTTQPTVARDKTTTQNTKQNTQQQTAAAAPQKTNTTPNSPINRRANQQKTTTNNTAATSPAKTTKQTQQQTATQNKNATADTNKNNKNAKQTQQQPDNKGKNATADNNKNTKNAKQTQQQPDNKGKNATADTNKNNKNAKQTQQQPDNKGKNATADNNKNTKNAKQTQQQPDNKGKNATADNNKNAKNAKQTQQQPDNKGKNATADNNKNNKNAKQNQQQPDNKGKNATADNNKNTKQTQQQNNTAQQKPKPAQTASPGTHTVVKGESLEKIAKKNGVTVDELRKANPNVKGDKIVPDEKLKIPKKKAATTSSTPALDKAKAKNAAAEKAKNTNTGKKK